MKRPHKGKRRVKSLEDVAINVEAADPVIQPSVPLTPDEVTECERENRQALTRHLHELLNSLWAASLQIEVAGSREICPEAFRDTLEQVRSSILEAMEIASRTSTLIDASFSSILDDSRASHGDAS